MRKFISQPLGPNVSEEQLNKWTTKQPKGAARSAAPLRFYCCPFVKDFLRNIRTERLKNKFPHNKRPEGSSKPTRVATHRAYDNSFGYNGLRRSPSRSISRANMFWLRSPSSSGYGRQVALLSVVLMTNLLAIAKTVFGY